MARVMLTDSTEWLAVGSRPTEALALLQRAGELIVTTIAEQIHATRAPVTGHLS